MATQSEIEMEKKLVAQLVEQGYELLEIKNEAALVANFKVQLEKHNKKELERVGRTGLTDDEFDQVLIELRKGDVFDKSERLRQLVLVKTNEGESLYLELFDSKNWCQNRFQVARQITNKSKDNHSRYDVTLLINGLPLIQVELKTRGSDIKSAFDQIARYRSTSYDNNSGLFGFIQIFIISNGVNTRYFANNRDLSFQFTFTWGTEDNKATNRLFQFAESFLEKCHISKMIARYLVIHQTSRSLMILRPYQYFAVERILERVRIGVNNGYIWHTTGSGKTLTSFKASQILSRDAKVDKVVFVVDRRDLDYQTALEFNAFTPDSVDTTENTEKLVKQLEDPNCKLVLTTIQKLNTALKKGKFSQRLEESRDQKYVFIFDECHRSQFGEAHKRITNFFRNRQLFGFTGTPIFDANIIKNKFGEQTTTDLFGECLHSYLITDAIRDANVLRFSVEYRAPQITVPNGNGIEEEIDEISLTRKEVVRHPKRVEAIVRDLVGVHHAKTHGKAYNSIFAVADVELLQVYYTIFKKLKEDGVHDLNIATIFSCAPGETGEFSGLEDVGLSLPEESFAPDMTGGLDADRLEFLSGCIEDYNQTFGTSYRANDSKSFYNYYQDLCKRLKKRGNDKKSKAAEIDILLVVNMFLTGFDAKPMNTIYTDKNLRHHGLIQAYSRTNRVFDKRKSHGNVVNYRDLKEATDEALAIFANRSQSDKPSDKDGEDITDIAILPSYGELLDEFRTKLEELKDVAPTPDDVNELVDDELLDFITVYRDVIRLQNTIRTFSEFEADIEEGVAGLNDQDLRDYASQYMDVRERLRTEDPPIIPDDPAPAGDDSADDTDKDDIFTILADIDFEVELIGSDEITVTYILRLIEGLSEEKNPKKYEVKRGAILDILQSEPSLRNKKSLFEQFIVDEESNLDPEKGKSEVFERFNAHVARTRDKALDTLAVEFDADPNLLKEIYLDFVYRDTTPDLRGILKTLIVKPKIKEQIIIVSTIRNKLFEIRDVHEDAAVDSEAWNN